MKSPYNVPFFPTNPQQGISTIEAHTFGIGLRLVEDQLENKIEHDAESCFKDIYWECLLEIGLHGDNMARY